MKNNIRIESILSELYNKQNINLISAERKKYLLNSNTRLKKYIYGESISTDILSFSEEPIIFINRIFEAKGIDVEKAFIEQFTNNIESNNLSNLSEIFAYFSEKEFKNSIDMPLEYEH